MMSLTTAASAGDVMLTLGPVESIEVVSVACRDQCEEVVWGVVEKVAGKGPNVVLENAPLVPGVSAFLNASALLLGRYASQ